MDPTLLQQQREPTPHASDERHEHNNEHEGAVEIVPEFTELKIDPPELPLRMTINPPLEYDGEQYKTLIFDFDAMIGKDFLRAEREFNRLYKPEKDEMVLPEMKHLYHQILAAHRANVPLGVIQKLPRRYYTPLRTKVLKACGSSPDEDEA